MEPSSCLGNPLLPRAAAKVDEAAVYHLKVQLHVMKSENQQAVTATALTCLRLLGIDLPARPTPEQVEAEYDTFWQTLSGRPIESLIDLPLMTDPELKAAIKCYRSFFPPPILPDFRFW